MSVPCRRLAQVLVFHKIRCASLLKNFQLFPFIAVVLDCNKCFSLVLRSACSLLAICTLLAPSTARIAQGGAGHHEVRGERRRLLGGAPGRLL